MKDATKEALVFLADKFSRGKEDTLLKIGDTQLWLNSGSTYEADVKTRPDVSVIKHGLRIPTEAKNYAEFALLIKWINRTETNSQI